MTSLACGRAASTASVYVQIAKRCITASTASRPPLDILAPRYYRKGTGCHLSYYTTSSTSHRNAVQGRRNSLSLRHRKSILLEQRRPFTTTRRRSATACVYNPQTDENGDEMVLEITDRAGKRLSQIMTKDSNPNLALRIQVESGGCHGFQYLMSLVTLPSTAEPTGHDTKMDSALGEDDTIFQYTAGEVAQTTTAEGAPKVVIDQPSLELLKGSKVDFTMELIGSQFKITDNPYATSACGCGTSFDIKM